jgi:curli biogenesis system outer membrane secretion channel CsgG
MDSIRKTWLRAVVAIASVVLSGCATGGLTASGPTPTTGASAPANAAANTAMYQTVNYANAVTKGPAIIVLPGRVKSNNATFSQRYGPNNIADYAELELSQANFQVLDRDNLGSVLREVELAYNLGDPAKAQALFQKGELQNTRWIVKFDVLRAEMVAKAGSGFSGDTLGGIANTHLWWQERLGGEAGCRLGADHRGRWCLDRRYALQDHRRPHDPASRPGIR